MHLRLISIGMLGVLFFFSMLSDDMLTIIIMSIIFIVYLCVFIYDVNQKIEPAFRNMPTIGRIYHIFHNHFKNKIYNRNQVEYIKKLSQNKDQTSSFGVKNQSPNTFVVHSNFPNRENSKVDKILIGKHQCSKHYSCNRINISALGFGPIGKNMIKSAARAAVDGGFFLNSGEDGISKHHRDSNIVFQIGTGYLGCQDTEGRLDEKKLVQVCQEYNIAMVEIKLSQGAKPGLGGILPAKKVTKEVAETGCVPKNKAVLTLPYHSEFDNWESLIVFIQKLRLITSGTPVGIKISVGNLSEYIQLFISIKKLDSFPDFITIDGSEGGSGASTPDFFQHVGMPLLDSIIITNYLLKKFNYKEKIKIIVSGRIVSAFDIIKYFALGADVCSIARAFMIAAGCVQTNRCHIGNCPSGIATQNKFTNDLIHVNTTSKLILNYHNGLSKNIEKLMDSMGISDIKNIQIDSFFHQNKETVVSLKEKIAYWEKSIDLLYTKEKNQ